MCSNLSSKLNRDLYLSALSKESLENNYDVFWNFACDSTNNLLAALYSLKYFDDDNKLLCLAGEVIKIRKIFDYKEEDAKGHIHSLLLHYEGSNKETFLFILINL